MKKVLIASSVLISGLLLAGCGTAPQSSSGNGTPSFALSQSLWRSDDGGATWAVKNKGTGKANASNVDVLSFAVDPTNGGHVYAGLRSGGILETTDAGDTWKFINFQSGKVYGLAVDASGKTLYASGVWQGTGKMFKTTDDGANWKEIYTSPSSGPLVVSLMIDKHDSNVLYASTSDNQVIKSTDGGTSWRNVYQANSPVLKVAIDAGNSSLIYFITQSGLLYQSKDAGATFQNMTDQINKSLKGSYGSRDFNVLTTDPTRAGMLYLAGEGGIVMSSDSGMTWKRIAALNDTQNFPIKVLAIDPDNSNDLIYGSSQATYRSTNGGAAWTTSQFEGKLSVNALAYNPQNPSIIYAGFTK
ncbi:MAG: hypothetical protein P4L62_00565 [Candidatus Pacebacteria bacterium]|nr:hypothetical protein [Candidatus Paceibacterota bacterium]